MIVHQRSGPGYFVPNSIFLTDLGGKYAHSTPSFNITSPTGKMNKAPADLNLTSAGGTSQSTGVNLFQFQIPVHNKYLGQINACF
jgi:hypothetical protein